MGGGESDAVFCCRESNQYREDLGYCRPWNLRVGQEGRKEASKLNL
jgi:hypothetical protein